MPAGCYVLEHEQERGDAHLVVKVHAAGCVKLAKMSTQHTRRYRSAAALRHCKKASAVACCVEDNCMKAVSACLLLFSPTACRPFPCTDTTMAELRLRFTDLAENALLLQCAADLFMCKI